MSSTKLSAPLRFQSREQKERIAAEAARRGQSVNQYVLGRADPVVDRRGALVAEAISSSYAFTEHSSHFEALDAQLAAGPHSTPAELGYDPAAAVDAAA